MKRKREKIGRKPEEMPARQDLPPWQENGIVLPLVF